MELQLNTMLDFCREPMLALENGTVSHLNTAARALFPKLSPGSSAVGFLPDHILSNDAEQFVTSAVLGGREFTVSVLRSNALRLLSFRAEQAADRTLVSEGLIGTMNASLFNIGLSAHQLEKRSDFAPPEVRQYLSYLRHNYHRLKRTLANLSLAAQFREKSVLLRPRRCDLAALCRELVSMVNSLGDGEFAALAFSSSLPSPEVCVDPELTEHMILNLLSNSFLHAPPDGTVRLGLEEKAGRVILSVDDEGSGIPDNVMQNVFSRYESRIGPDTLTDPLSGGLGLSLARHIAELHGGALIIESKPGRGTSVRVMLPKEQPDCDILEDPHNAASAVSLDLLLTELSDVLGAKCYAAEPNN